MEGKTVVSVVAVGCFCLLFLIRAVCVLFGGVAIWYSWVKFLHFTQLYQIATHRDALIQNICV